MLNLSTVVLNTACAQTETIAYTASNNGPYGSANGNDPVNIGQTFSLYNSNIVVYYLGAYNFGGDGLNYPHTVTLFSITNGVYTPVAGGSVTVPAGTNAILLNGYRFQTLTNPLTISPGSYAVIAFQMNNSDPYSDANNSGFNSASVLVDNGGVYQFCTNASPNFPSAGGSATGSGVDYGSASFIYSVGGQISTNANTNNASSPVSPPTITTLSLTANAGQTVSLYATPNGTPPANYQWYYGSSLVPIGGATNSLLILTNIQVAQTPGNIGNYSVAAQNSIGASALSTNSSHVNVTVVPNVRPLNIMPVGDSITLGFRSGIAGYRSPLYQYLTNANIAFQFVGTDSNCYNSCPSFLPYLNHDGVSGSIINGPLGGYPIWTGQIPTPDIVLLLIGTNDYGMNTDPADATNRLDALIEEIATNTPNAKVIVANLLMRTDNSTTDNQIQTNFNPYLPSLVANHANRGEHIYFVDMRSALGASDLSDGLHPNQTGYNKMARVWYTAITNIFPPPPATNTFVSTTRSNATVTFYGVPGFQYITQRSANSNGGGWVSISTNTIPGNGMLQVVDTFGAGGANSSAGYYRLQLVLFPDPTEN